MKPIGAYIIVVGLVFGSALLPPKGMLLFGDDIHHQYYFFREFFNQWLRAGVFPWWNPYIFSGQPFIADPMVNIWYPLTWLFVLLPLNVAYSWHIAFHVFWAMLGMYVLTVNSKHLPAGKAGLTVNSKLPAFVSGVVFGLSGFFMARTWAGHVDVIAAASWIPWVVYAFSRQNIVLSAIFFALQLFSGYQTMAFFTVIIVGIVASFQSFFNRSLRPIVRAMLAGIMGIGLAAIQILPEQEFFRASIRTYSLPYSWVSYGSWMWASLLQFLNPFFFGNQHAYVGLPPNFIEHSAFVGIGGLVLMAIGVLRAIRERREIWGKIFLCIAFFGLWVSFGPNAPIDLQYILWKIVPMYHYLRIPPRHLVLVVFGLAGLAGIGFEVVSKSLKQRKLLKGLMVAGIIVEMVLFGRNFIELRPGPEARQDTALISILRQDAQLYRVVQDFGVWLPTRDALEFDGVMPNGIFSATGYDTSILRNYYEYVASASGQQGSVAVLSQDVQVPYLNPASADAIDRLNIKYIMVPRLYDPFGGNTRYTLLRDTTYRLYENTTVKPRFYFNNTCGAVRVESYTPNKIILRTDSTCADTLLSSEVWYPGWTATIDGNKVSIGKSNNVFRTLFVSSGKHTIVYEYQPGIFSISGIISLCTALFLLAYGMRERKVSKNK